MDDDMTSLVDWISIVGPELEAAVQLLGFKDFNHYMQIYEMVALANAR